ncbi:unnamed protein product [Kuraishia capsulata CBS 1993]|uniref:Plasma membrane fusion protein PRM1 n=1 Tax=Kuraishia capsulata CBS 1993 TaxID=1382522 RepID=W6MKJ2_9ASCO|nr:uncharacterized protein KUCA_T00002871001 [Kuraishia capsulata CBS 1993]CDK26896.1 unnamed protein product [Kuraishia capsulata CBS 1993]
MRAYLNLNERLSQVWLNQFTILLLLILCKFVLFGISLKSSLEVAKANTESSCVAAEKYASAMVSLPHYAARASNYLITTSVQEANKGISEGLAMVVEAAEQLLIFTFDMFVGTYVCLLTAAVDGSVDIAVNATEAIISVANDTVISLADDIQDALDGVEKVVNKVIKAADKVESFFTGDDDDDDVSSGFSSVNLTISSLKDWQIPSSVNSELNDLANKVPNFDEVQNKTDQLISIPFNKLQKVIKSKERNTESSSSIAVPSIRNVSFCSTGEIDDFYDHSYKIIHIWVCVMISLLALCSLCMMLFSAWGEYKQWKRLKTTTENVKAVASRTGNNDNVILDIIDQSQHRYGSAIGAWFARKSSNPEKQIHIRWVFNYVTSRVALSTLILGLTGLVTTGLQFAVLSGVTGNSSEIETALTKAASSISSDAYNSIKEWATDTNDYLTYKEKEINKNVLGWVNTSTTSVNSTIVEFLDRMDDTIDSAFEGTLFYSPVKAVVGCTIENKLKKIEKGLTWIHDHANVSFPRVSADTMWSQIYSNSSSKSTDTSEYVSDVKKSATSAIKAVISMYKKSLKIELYISLGLLLLWVILVIIALLMILIRIHSERNNEEFEDFFSTPSKVSDPMPLTTPQRVNFGYPAWDEAAQFKTTDGTGSQFLEKSDTLLNEGDDRLNFPEYSSVEPNQFKFIVTSTPKRADVGGIEASDYHGVKPEEEVNPFRSPKNRL